MKENEEKYRNFKQIVNAFYSEQMHLLEDQIKQVKESEEKVSLIPHLIYDKTNKLLKIEIFLKKDKQYKIKNIVEFYNRFLSNEEYKYGNNFELVHKKESFDNESLELLDFILEKAEIIKYVNNSITKGYKNYNKKINENFIILIDGSIDKIFDILKNREIVISLNYKEQNIILIEEAPDIKFNIIKDSDKYSLISNIPIQEYTILEGKDFSYILLENKLYRVTKKFQKSIIMIQEMFRLNLTDRINFGKENLPEFFGVIYPRIRKNVQFGDIYDEIKKYIPKELEAKIFLDITNARSIIADVKFCYGEIEINPIDSNQNSEIIRNIFMENEALNLLRKTGFMVDLKNKRFILNNEEKIYEFITKDIFLYREKFKVMTTENFNKTNVRNIHIGGIGVKIENNLIDVDINKLGLEINEIIEILEKYNLKQKYYRLKDGSFINLIGNKEVEFLNDLQVGLGINFNRISDTVIKVPIYRGLYLDNILKKIDNINNLEDIHMKHLVSDIIEKKENGNQANIPISLKGILRDYQIIGFNWLKNIDKYGLGGILADDMGLGKTIQILSIILDYIDKTNKKDRKPSIVICPSSLTLNWKNEIEKFTNNVKVLVISGNIENRKKQIREINKYDIVITSYDLLKRDIEFYNERNYDFRYAIADEAQYIKNSNTQNAKALKKISAETRYALTGTPIENSLAELWSIFDYIMPGYLFSYRKFKENYEIKIIKEKDVETINRLKMLIEPFILRRTKKDVLKELPDKSITILNNEMDEEQENVYKAYLAEAKTELIEDIKINGFENSRIKILALLTRLRQVCCHPGLFIDNYIGESSKLNQCIDILKSGIDAGHKILLFSSYTSMFDIIEDRLKEEKIKYFKLTGQTKVDKRIELVNEFNQNPAIKVFLISLKAGGTGLNLTGADMVIHYDPWWNASAENQATDRAHRIGQKNSVQVYKLITNNSIEEKIYELQQRKNELIDNMLSTQATFINKLSKEEIMNLFK